MVYIYKKSIGEKDYYYLRASVKSGNRALTKDIAYLGSDITKIKEKLDRLSSEYSQDIRKAYKSITRFIESNHYLQKAQSKKLKHDPYLKKQDLQSTEAIRLHWKNVFKKQDSLTQKEIFKNFLVEFAFNTTSLEGNTITLQQAQKLLVDNLTPRNKSLREIHDLKNTDTVFFSLLENLKRRITHELVNKVHDNLMRNIDERQGYRTQEVRVFRMHFVSSPAQYVKTDMDILLKWYNKNVKKVHPLVLAVTFHHKFEKIHPYMDGNGRTGRMLTNFILLKQGYPPIIIRKKNRIRYINSLNKADKTPLDSLDEKYYRNLIEFVAGEYKEIYWNIFL